MIAITPPKIFSKEVAQNKATPLTAPATSLTTRNRFTPNFRGWRLDENLKPKSPPYRGVKRAVTNRGPLVIAAQSAGVKKVLANSEPSAHGT